MSAPATTRSARPGEGDGNATAARLLRSAAKKSYDPDVDIDWDAPLVEGAIWVPEHRVSLYGTELWERLTPEQRIELGKHEACSVASVGLWFETLLMQRLLKDFYADDPTSDRAQWALTEVADECRHSQMFARLVHRAGVEPYGPIPFVHQLGKLFSVVNWGPAAYASILVAEEVLDRLQREQANDDRIQPLMRQVNRIHIMEEARHVAFARDEVTRGLAGLSRAELAYQRFMCAFTSFFVVRSLINPKVYAAVGIDPAEGRRAALANPHHREMIRFGGEKILAFLDEAGMIAGPGQALWKKSFLLEK
ncbi:diiron oxygenase [Actinomycetospora sp. NBRC 106378]|uniref:AurF N-oxygenase family protein n=1 Tax=Actinomycetospora sp. NBRC 106378 TaxID=3032208 RepID=UPI0024A4EBD2|nr:diiron oxygenase [Actinomycetospora sp. NBRC 106378]GLZ54238.1 membrane protein [Actinomycetospora sp. NBRC 106378]